MSKCRRIVVAAACAALPLLQHEPAMANLIVGGGFELPIVAVGGFASFIGGSVAIPQWTVVGNGVDVVSTAFTFGAFSLPAHSGNQWLDITGSRGGGATGVTQSVATTIGQTYALSFWIGNAVNASLGTSSSTEVFVGGASLGIFTNSDGAGVSSLVWKPFTTSFSATSASTIVSFINRDLNDSANGLDDVVLELAVVDPPSPVPVPATLGLLAVATLPLAWRRGRRTR